MSKKKGWKPPRLHNFTGETSDYGKDAKVCRNCGMVRVPKVSPYDSKLKWVEYFDRNGQRINTENEPECEATQ